ncbi:hypothetical protein EI42_04775 [Thermosporothrix hazakensis]|jgi:hypothetical protein|uniref:Integral membrane protein n=2 Tax=Thermosporothrix TaxID=768650 RepID=A0A326U0U2_THEHA|nr:hypothetical protein [Thermosporothrix hazakensis]PZW24084.1 hypothetical protein EI42_04775 [Thermosporothrix hazakensis]BBH87872.1 hypothetical protein KTC_26230 [Thermosporothrix sp. COM3]GCE50297.1 hypothetical protein KTH_51660 [Thermosporothrix hazakensis]
MNAIQHPDRIARRMHIVRLAALADLVLLIALVTAALTGQREIVHILGPLHGINYLLLLAIVSVGALDGLWKWWFPLAVLLTAGPPGAFVGEWLIHRSIRERSVQKSDTPSILQEEHHNDWKEQG